MLKAPWRRGACEHQALENIQGFHGWRFRREWEKRQKKPQKNRKAGRSRTGSGLPWQSSRGLVDRKVDWAGPGIVLQVRLDLNLEAGLVSNFTCLVSCQLGYKLFVLKLGRTTHACVFCLLAACHLGPLLNFSGVPVSLYVKQASLAGL